MSRLDLVIFGASGYTGKYVVEEMVRISKNYPEIAWAVAGRSQSKLEDMLKEISKKTNEDLSSMKIIIADAEDEKSLKDMCSQAKVLVTCCGPYRHYGEPVVKAAIDSKTHYIDISAEPEFIETMQLKYDKAARDAGVYIIRACGFDCIPTDLGVVFLQQNFKGTLNSVESYLSLKAPLKAYTGRFVNYGTWESLLYQMAHYKELPALRKKMYPQELPTFEPTLKPRRVIHRHQSTWCAPFPSGDAAVAGLTQRYLYEQEHLRPAHVKTYITSPNLPLIILIFPAVLLIYFLSQFTLTRTFMLNWPRLCTLNIVSKTPNEQTVKAVKFKFQLFGEGWDAETDVDAVPPNKKMIVTVSGSNAYTATAVGVVFSAITLLKEKDKMPAFGVITPGVAFRNTNLINHLNENNLKFEVVDKN